MSRVPGQRILRCTRPRNRELWSMLALVYIYIFEFLDFEETRKSIETDDSFPRFRSISSYPDNFPIIAFKSEGRSEE